MHCYSLTRHHPVTYVSLIYLLIFIDFSGCMLCCSFFLYSPNYVPRHFAHLFEWKYFKSDLKNAVCLSQAKRSIFKIQTVFSLFVSTSYEKAFGFWKWEEYLGSLKAWRGLYQIEMSKISIHSMTEALQNWLRRTKDFNLMGLVAKNKFFFKNILPKKGLERKC